MLGNQLAAGQALTVANDSFNGDGSTVAFTLSHTVGSVNDIEVLVDNVQQSPYDGSYSVSGTTLTFSGAPSAGTNNVYVIYNASKHITTQQVIPDSGSITHSMIHPSATVITKSSSAPSNPANGDVWYDTDDYKISFWDGTAWQLIKSSFTATGGITSDGGGYRYHQFNSTGNFVVSKGSALVEYIIVAGGGSAAGGEYATGGGGGGAGGVLYGNTNVSAQTYAITIGAGGASVTGSASGAGNAGGDSTAFGLSAIGGGHGAGYPNNNPQAGGSGGGASWPMSNSTGGAGTSGQGNAGGTHDQSLNSGGGDARIGCGGGGATGNGEDWSTNGVGAGNAQRGTDGGPGYTWLNGTTYGGGGGGGASDWSDPPSGGYSRAGNGGAGGGGNGRYVAGQGNAVAGFDGSANTGGGAGGSSFNGGLSQSQGLNNAAGGSGIVIIRYAI